MIVNDANRVIDTTFGCEGGLGMKFCNVRSLFWLIVALSLASVQGETQAQEYPEEITFKTFVPCSGNADFCAPQILARGIIDREAPERLRKVLDSWPSESATIAFDSPGGKLVAGVQMGQLIRARGFNTLVAPTYTEEMRNGQYDVSERVVASGAVCLSACAYAFLGGVSRTVENDGVFGVHQFITTSNGVAESDVQMLTAVLSQYVKRMGVGRDLLDVASITSASDVAIISREDAVQYNVDNQQPKISEWNIDALDSGEIVLTIEQQLPGSDRISRIVIMPFGENKEWLRLFVVHGIFEERSEKRILAAINDKRKGQLCSDSSDCVDAQLVEGWNYDKSEGTINAFYLVDTAEFLNKLSSEGFSFDAGFGRAASDASPNVDLGGAGLFSGLKALARSN